LGWVKGRGLFLQPHSNKCITFELPGLLPNVLCSRDASISLAGTYPELHSSTGDPKGHHLLVKMKTNMFRNSYEETQKVKKEIAQWDLQRGMP